MGIVHVNRFDGGMAGDIYGGAIGECSVCKHFDTLTYPHRLSPLRGMTADTSGTGMVNLLVGSDNGFYGLGGDAANVSLGTSSLWKRGSSSWTQFSHTSGDTLVNDLLVEYHDSSGNRLLFYAGPNLILFTKRNDTAVISTHALTYTKICQGFVHPKDDCLYIGYDNKIALNNNGTWTDAAFTLPANYRVTGLRDYGDYLAIACCPQDAGQDAGGGGQVSKVFLWDRNTSNTTVNETVDWGAGNLLVLNNLGGVLIGISDMGGRAVPLDQDSIVIRAYQGGAPVVLKEILTIKQTSTAPDASINSRVNFIYRDRMYFSINIASGSTSPSYAGLWSIGKSKIDGRWAVTIERMATTGGTETSVLAAAVTSDYYVIVYNAAGTMVVNNVLTGTDSPYTATSVHETLVNPQMQDADRPDEKQLIAFAVHTMPLLGTAQVVAKYRVDGGSWVTIFTKTASSPDTKLTIYEATKAASAEFESGRHYEFRLESTLGAQITGYTYLYRNMRTNIT